MTWPFVNFAIMPMKPFLVVLCSVSILSGCVEENSSSDDFSIPSVVYCEACKRKVSTHVEKCPDCSHPMEDTIQTYAKAHRIIEAAIEEEEKTIRKDYESQIEDLQESLALAESKLTQLNLGGQPLDLEPSGEEKYYELTGLITNLGGPVKSRYINIELKLEGLAGDFEKLIEINEHRVRDRALTIMGQYTYEDALLDGFQERVRSDLKKSFGVTLRKYRNGESDLIRNIYFTQFVVQ